MMRKAWPFAAALLLSALAPPAAGGVCDATSAEQETLGLGDATTTSLVSIERERDVHPANETFTARVLALASKPGVQLAVEDTISYDETVTIRCAVHRARDATLEDVTVALALGAPAPSLFALSQERFARVDVEITVHQRVDLTHEAMMGFLLLEGVDAKDALTTSRTVEVEREIELCTRLASDAASCPQAGGITSASDSIT